jgi:hypothetical protein
MPINVFIRKGLKTTKPRCDWHIHWEIAPEWVNPDADGRYIPTKTGVKIPIIPDPIARLYPPATP